MVYRGEGCWILGRAVVGIVVFCMKTFTYFFIANVYRVLRFCLEDSIVTTSLRYRAGLDSNSINVRSLVIVTRGDKVSAVTVASRSYVTNAMENRIVNGHCNIGIVSNIRVSTFSFRTKGGIRVLSCLTSSPGELRNVYGHASITHGHTKRVVVLGITDHFPVASSFVVNRTSNSAGLFGRRVVRTLVSTKCASDVFNSLCGTLFSRGDRAGILTPAGCPDIRSTVGRVRKTNKVTILTRPSGFGGFSRVSGCIRLKLSNIRI